jgi:type IV pilus assembly protein PilQ
MKKHKLITLMFVAPLALWAQVAEPALSEIDLSDVVIIEEIAAPMEPELVGPEVVAAPELTDVEITVETIDPSSHVDTLEASVQVDAPALSGFGAIAAVRADEVVAPDVALADVGEVVEIPEVPTEGAVIDVETPEIPVVEVAALPSDSEVILELPGQETTPGTAMMAEEETISVDFPDEEVRTILRNVADLFDLNVVIPDTLQGRTSVKLHNITWRQVFEVVLKQQNFTYIEDRNIIQIISIEELTTEPVDVRVFVLNYARADELQGSISPLIDAAAGGRIQVDVRSNALVITERPSRINRIQEIIAQLDKPTAQVMIESKFIEVSSGDLENIGVDWAYLNQNAGDLLGGDGAGSGNPGFQSRPTDPGDIGVGVPNGAVVGGADTWGNGLANIATGGASGGLVAVFSSSQFAATITALQSEQRSKLVSNPTIVVMNNQTAKFQVGEDYPVRQFSVNNETGLLETGEIEYRFVGVELDVTPSVNAAGMISMDVHPVVSALGDVVVTQAGPGGLTLLEDRIFKKRDAQTQVTIKDGYTIALGGLTAEDKRDNKSRVPILGDLPFIGKLFQDNSSSSVSTNLIIFLTARTLNPDGSDYRDMTDPRQLEMMKLTPDQVPGYQISAEEKALIDQVEAVRSAENLTAYKAKVNAQINPSAVGLWEGIKQKNARGTDW